MHEPRSFAYSLSQSEDGWCWRVIDENGEIVARGAHACRTAAEVAVGRHLAGGTSPQRGGTSTVAMC